MPTATPTVLSTTRRAGKSWKSVPWADAQGRISHSQTTYGTVGGSANFSFTTGQSFDSDGQLASHTYPDGSTQTYSYTKGQLAQITLPNKSEIHYQNYQWNMPMVIQTPGATKSSVLDALQRPTSIQVKNSNNQILASKAYQYDKAGNISQIDSDLGTTQYGYDNLDRLTQAVPDQSLQGLGLPSEHYGYDAVGNRTSSAHQPGAWAYNADNQMVRYPSKTPFSSSPVLDTQVSYTPQGHTQQETSGQDSKTYRYNAAERLITYESSDGTQAHYRYDPIGRRISKSVIKDTATQVTYFIYSEQALMGELDKDGMLQRAYGFDPVAGQQGSWSTDPIWQADAINGSLSKAETGYNYLHTDYLGTPILATEKNGGVTWKAVMEAFGMTAVVENQMSMNLRFPGQYFDDESKLNYNFFRDYNPYHGRYNEGDPIGLSGGVNGYIYALGNPIFNYDPDGRKAKQYCPGTCSDLVGPVASMLRAYRPNIYATKKCKIQCDSMWRGLGKNSGAKVTINSKEYDVINYYGNSIMFVWTIAHELRHCNNSAWEDFPNQITPISDEDGWFNKKHNELDREAEKDAWDLYNSGQIEKLFKEKNQCSNC